MSVRILTSTLDLDNSQVIPADHLHMSSVSVLILAFNL